MARGTDRPHQAPRRPNASLAFGIANEPLTTQIHRRSACSIFFFFFLFFPIRYYSAKTCMRRQKGTSVKGGQMAYRL
ncbi:hypothetical protein LZ32DRAFT_204843 [Colletotrichum eremochloae]|nr:hypothetical protein LZ32DRAFT_204843 [Colletotrichum eremochloae]